MKRRAAVVVFAVVAAISLCLAPASATGRRHGGHGKVLVVDNEHRHRSCLGTRDPFQSIQAAVKAAHAGDTVRVCPGLYEETVKVRKPRLTLKGANAGRDATGRSRRQESIVTSDDTTGAVQLLADDITWDGFTIRGVRGEKNGPGMYTSPDHSGYLIRDTIFKENGIGLHLGADGRHLMFVCRNRFVANNEFITGGYGIYSDEGAEKVLITSNRFERHNGAAVFFADHDLVGRTPSVTQQHVLVEKNRSVDDKTFAAVFASAHVHLRANSIRARVNDDAFPLPASAIRIGARNHDIVVYKNRVYSASGNGIDVTDSGEPGHTPAAPTMVDVSKNKVEHAQLLGIDVSASGVGQYQVRKNRARDNTLVGIHLGPATDDALVTGNTALDNGLDCQDESPGVKNAWQENVGVTSDPPHLCTAPTGTHQPGNGGGGHHPHKPKKDPCTCQKHHPRAF